MGNHPLPRPVEPHTFPRAETRQRRPGPEPRGPEGKLDTGWAPYWYFRFLAPPSPDRLHRWCCPPSARPRSVGREPEPANGEGGSKGTSAKSWKRSRRGRDEDSQTSQKERAASGEMRIGVLFDLVSFCHNRSELRERAGKPMIEHERERTNTCSFQKQSSATIGIILRQRTDIKDRSHRLVCGAP